MNQFIQNFKKKVELFVELQKRTMDKFIKINKKNELESTGECCLNEKYLKHDNLLDLDGLDLFSELNILKGDYRIGKW